MKPTIPELSFVVHIGVSRSGKSKFARKHFKPTEILSPDARADAENEWRPHARVAWRNRLRTTRYSGSKAFLVAGVVEVI